jgi:hypothetical protein
MNTPTDDVRVCVLFHEIVTIARNHGIVCYSFRITHLREFECCDDVLETAVAVKQKATMTFPNAFQYHFCSHTCLSDSLQWTVTSISWLYATDV